MVYNTIDISKGCMVRVFLWTQKLNLTSLKYEDGNSLEKAKFCLQWFSTEKFGPLLKYCRPRTQLGGADFQ